MSTQARVSPSPKAAAKKLQPLQARPKPLKASPPASEVSKLPKLPEPPVVVPGAAPAPQKPPTPEIANPPAPPRNETTPVGSDKRTEEQGALSEISRSLKTLEERLASREMRTVERGVGTSEETKRQLILLRTETVRVERRVDEEKEKLKSDLAQARRDNAALYVLLEERGQGERVPPHVKMPEIPKLDLSAGDKRRVKRETAEKLRRLEDVLPKGFIRHEMIRSAHEDEPL